MAITLYCYCLSRMAQIRSVLPLGDDLNQVCTAVLIPTYEFAFSKPLRPTCVPLTMPRIMAPCRCLG